MIGYIGWVFAGISTTAFVALWFWVAWRELRQKQNTVESAECQLTASRQQMIRKRDGPEEAKARDIMERSQSIYRQAVVRYNETLRKPWNAVPALFLGFRAMKGDDV